jgi:hypothetical protein
MRMTLFLAGVGLALAVSGCSSGDKEWMKVGQTYTVEEFRRDHAACTKAGRLDETCMRDRGWIDVSPKGADKGDKKDEVDRNLPARRY